MDDIICKAEREGDYTMKDHKPDPEAVIRTLAVYLLLCAFVRGYYYYRQSRLEAMYGEDYSCMVTFPDELKGDNELPELKDSLLAALFL